MTNTPRVFLVLLTTFLVSCANTLDNSLALIFLASPFAPGGHIDECQDRSIEAYVRGLKCPNREGSPLTRSNVNKEQVLASAMWFDRIDIFEEALMLGADPMKQDRLYWQVGRQCNESPLKVKEYLLLLKKYNRLSEFKTRLIFLAVESGHSECVDLAFYFGAPPNAKDTWHDSIHPCYDATPLCPGIMSTLNAAANKRSISEEMKILRQLLEEGTSPDISKYEGNLKKLRYNPWSDQKRVAEAWEEIYQLLGNPTRAAAPLIQLQNLTHQPN